MELLRPGLLVMLVWLPNEASSSSISLSVRTHPLLGLMVLARSLLCILLCLVPPIVFVPYPLRVLDFVVDGSRRTPPTRGFRGGAHAAMMPRFNWMNPQNWISFVLFPGQQCLRVVAGAKV